MTKAVRRSRTKPCAECGGEKEPGSRARTCATCRERKLPPSQQALRRRDQVPLRDPTAKRKTAKDAPPGMRWCPRCQQYRSLRDFQSRGSKTAGNRKTRGYCTPCNSDYVFGRTILKRYGITLDHYYALLDQQSGRCAICLKRPRTQRLAVDHDHATGKVRGLLCWNCNHGLLGAAHDQESLLIRAALYLHAPPAQTGATIDDMTAAVDTWRAGLETFDGYDRTLVTDNLW